MQGFALPLKRLACLVDVTLFFPSLFPPTTCHIESSFHDPLNSRRTKVLHYFLAEYPAALRNASDYRGKMDWKPCFVMILNMTHIQNKSTDIKPLLYITL